MKSQWAVKTLEGLCEVRGGRRKRGGAPALAGLWDGPKAGGVLHSPSAYASSGCLMLRIRRGCREG